MTRPPFAGARIHPQEPQDAILILLDVVGYTPQARAAGSGVTQLFDAALRKDLIRRGKKTGVHFIKSIGDAALLWCRKPDNVLKFATIVFKGEPPQARDGFVPALRMLAHKDWFTFSRTRGAVSDVHGLEAVVLFRLEKKAHANRIVVTPHLFGGMRHLLPEFDITFREIVVDDELKGVGGASPRSVYILTPPLASQAQDAVMPAGYRVRRGLLRQEVQSIPVFGSLYPPIPMAENFLDLTLDLQRTKGLSNYYYPRLESASSRLGLGAGITPPADDSPASRMVERISSDRLYANFRTGFVTGLPGAGKTTILRHFAWRALEDDPFAIVLLVEARHISDELVSEMAPTVGEASTTPSRADFLRVVCALFLEPGISPRIWTQGARNAITDCATAIETLWQDVRVIILIDGLDEAPTPRLRDWLAQGTSELMSDLGEPLSSAPESKDPPRPGRCYLSVRAAELERQASISATHAPVFLVNPLNQEQVRSIAARRYGEESPLYGRFDDIIWRRPDLTKIAGTPLTAMLLVFFFEVRGEFALRFAMYRLVVLFVLDRAWWRIKTGEFGSPRSGLNTFFHDVLRQDFLAKRPGLKSQMVALGQIAWAMLYKSRRSANASERTIHRVELRTLLERHLSETDPESASTADDWTDAWERENLLLPAGPEKLAFLHSTILEFLAATALLPSTAQTDALLVASVSDRSKDSFEVLPILCSQSKEAAWRVLARLGSQLAAFAPEATLPFRCLCEAEAAELEDLGMFDNAEIRLEREAQSASRIEKDWAYEHVADWVLRPKGLESATQTLEAAQVSWLNERTAALVDQPTLCKAVLADMYLGSWHNDGTPLAKAQAGLLERILAEDLRAAPELRRRLSSPEYAQASEAAEVAWREGLQHYRGDLFAGEVRRAREACRQAYAETGTVLRLDVPGQEHDRNIAYLRVEYGEALSGLFGSPNFKHGAQVRTVAYSPDGRVALSGDVEGRLMLWHAGSGRELRSWQGHGGPIRSSAFSPDGAAILSCSGRELHLWDTLAGQVTRSLTGHTDRVTCVAFSPDGAQIVSASADRTLKTWDVSTGRQLRSFLGHVAPVTSCMFGPDGRHVVSASDDMTLGLWDTSSGERLRSFRGHERGLWSCAFSPDGKRVLSASEDGSLALWDVGTGDQLRSLTGHKAGVRACAFSPDGAQILSTSDDQTIRVWHAESGQELRSLTGHTGAVWCGVFSPDGARILSASSDQTVRQWDAASGRAMHSLSGHTRRITACALSPDGAHVLSASEDRHLKLWEATTGREIRSFVGHSDSVMACAFSPDGTRILSSSVDRTLILWDAASGRVLRALQGGEGRAARCCAFSPDGTRVLSASGDYSLVLWDSATGRPLRSFGGLTEPVTYCAFSPDGSRIVGASEGNTLQTWDAVTARRLRTFTGHSDLVTFCSFSRDGSRILSASSDKTVKAWDAATGRRVATFTGHTARVNSATFSANGATIATASDDGTVRIWDSVTARESGVYDVGWSALGVDWYRDGSPVVALANGTLVVLEPPE